MRSGFRISSLVPSGLAVESVSYSPDSIILVVRSEAFMAECPLCEAASRGIHSRYVRQVADLPCAGIDAAPARRAPKRVFVTLDADSVSISSAAPSRVSPGTDLHGLQIVIGACYAASVVLARVIDGIDQAADPRFRLPGRVALARQV